MQLPIVFPTNVFPMYKTLRQEVPVFCNALFDGDRHYNYVCIRLQGKPKNFTKKKNLQKQEQEYL